jgi:hypothetical protein
MPIISSYYLCYKILTNLDQFNNVP